MSDYRVAAGSNLSLALLTKLNPQPRSMGLQITRRNYLLAGGVVDEGPYIELLFSLLPNTSVYSSILGAFGLVSAPSAAVTLYARDDLYTYHRYNGVAIRPEVGWENYFPRNIVVLVRDLVLIA